jgi:hypothetical protein
MLATPGKQTPRAYTAVALRCTALLPGESGSQTKAAQAHQDRQSVALPSGQRAWKHNVKVLLCGVCARRSACIRTVSRGALFVKRRHPGASAVPRGDAHGDGIHQRANAQLLLADLVVLRMAWCEQTLTWCSAHVID